VEDDRLRKLALSGATDGDLSPVRIVIDAKPLVNFGVADGAFEAAGFGNGGLLQGHADAPTRRRLEGLLLVFR
jgi:hypothetical protein